MKYLVFLPDRIIVTSIGTKADCDRNLIIEADNFGYEAVASGVALKFRDKEGQMIAVFAPGHWTMMLEYETALSIQEAAKQPQIIKK